MFLDGFGLFTGLNASEVSEEVISELKLRGFLVAREKYPHVYPHCWRCKSELVFRPVDGMIHQEWIESDSIQRDKAADPPDPAEGEARELDWLRNMSDWMISKKRFWGLALPIWVCTDCDHFTVIGSREELQSKAVEGWDVFDGNSPHRPFVDAVKIRCEKCGGLSTRVEDVGNPWLDAGVVPFSTPAIRQTGLIGRNGFRRIWCSKSFRGTFATGSIRCWR